jgi:apolipoprotein N-acyltransferase
MKTVRCYPILAVLLAAASGALFAFAVPPRQIGILGWIAFLPLLLAARMTRPLIAAGCGLLCSLTAALILSGHIEEASQFGNLVAVFGSLGLVLAFAAGFASVGKKLSPAVEPLFIACAGVTAELLSVGIFPINVAISQYQDPAMLRLASVTGIWGVSFMIWLVAASIVAMFRGPKAAWPAFALAVVALAASATVKLPVEHGGRVARVAAIQAADPYSAARKTRDVRGVADIVVWPEHRIDSGAGQRIPMAAANSNGLCIVADLRELQKGGKPYNTACLIGTDGNVIARQRKRFPFGDENRIFARGRESRPVKCAAATVGMAICYDTQFTAVIRDLARSGADVICVPIHDPEMPNSLLNYLHVAVITFRAAENGVPIVSAECYGLSSIIDGSGRIIARAPVGTTGATYAPVRLRTARTLATQWGDWFAWGCATMVVLIPVAASLKRRHSKSENADE